MRVLVGLWFMSACMQASTVYAQATDDRPEASVATGFTQIWYPELGYGGWSVAGSVRFPVSEHVSIEPEMIVTRHGEDRHFGGGSLPGTETRSRRTNWSAGLNLIVSRRSGRLRPFAGGGVGIYGERSSFETIVPPPNPSAGVFRTEREMTPQLGAQGVAGLDVALSRRATVFAAFRADARTIVDAALGFHYLAGTRIRF